MTLKDWGFNDIFAYTELGLMNLIINTLPKMVESKGPEEVSWAALSPSARITHLKKSSQRLCYVITRMALKVSFSR